MDNAKRRLPRAAKLKDQLMQPDSYEEFIAEFNLGVNSLASNENQEREHLERAVNKIEGRIARLIEAILIRRG